MSHRTRRTSWRAMLPYIAAEVARGTRLAAIVHSMLGLFQGVPGRAAGARS